MNKSRLAVSLLALFSSAPCLAWDCMLPASAQLAPSLNVVAPEMARPAAVNPFCITVQDALAQIKAQLAASAPGTYVPLTKDDNTPWRFDMSQNGKHMTSVEFDAWMKAKGIRVATGKPAEAAAPDSMTPQPPAQSNQ